MNTRLKFQLATMFVLLVTLVIQLITIVKM